MSAKDKLIERFKNLPKDFTFDELVKLLTGFGFVVSNRGKTSGSRVRFEKKDIRVFMDIHKPHTSGAPIKKIVLKDIFNKLFDNGLIQ
jgi:hypothetical protein